MQLSAPFALWIAAMIFTSATAIASEEKSKKALGQEWDVRVSAAVVSDSPTSPVVRVAWEVENLGEHNIQVATVPPVASWDPESRVFTLNVGSELPISDETKLVQIAPNESKLFSTSTPLGMTAISRGREASIRRLVRVKLHFLDAGSRSTEGEEADLFDTWVENKRSVVTNAIPVTIFMGIRHAEEPPARRARGRRP